MRPHDRAGITRESFLGCASAWPSRYSERTISRWCVRVTDRYNERKISRDASAIPYTYNVHNYVCIRIGIVRICYLCCCPQYCAKFLHCTNSRTPKSITKRRYSFASAPASLFGRHADAKQGCDLDHPNARPLAPKAEKSLQQRFPFVS